MERDVYDILREHMGDDQIRLERLIAALGEHRYVIAEVSQEVAARVPEAVAHAFDHAVTIGDERVELDLYEFLSHLAHSGLYVVARPEMRSDIFALEDGALLTTHPVDRCSAPCPVHSPSDHPLRKAPIRYEEGRMERTCSHGRRHPDPDHLAFIEQVEGPLAWMGLWLHDCDGCCGLSSPPGGV